MIALIDTHSHIDLPVFDDEREEVISRASAAGISAIVVIGHNPDRWRTSAELCARYPALVRTVSLHPNDAAAWTDAVLDGIEHEIATGEPIAIGETGLDFYRDSAPAEMQRTAFAAQIELAGRHDLPIIIHQRNAEREVLEMLRERGPVRGVMHCFSGDATFAAACVDAGLMLGVGGVATYPKSNDVRQAIASTPLDALMLETDAPYLAPQPWRGKRNEPSYVVAAAEVIASVHGVSLEDVGGKTTANAVRLFGPRLEAAWSAGLRSA